MDPISPEVHLWEFSQIHRPKSRIELFKFRFGIPNFEDFAATTASSARCLISTFISRGVEPIEWRIEGNFQDHSAKLTLRKNEISSKTVYAKSTVVFHYVKSTDKMQKYFPNLRCVLARKKLFLHGGSLAVQCELRLKYTSTPQQFKLNLDWMAKSKYASSLLQLQSDWKGLHASEKHTDFMLTCQGQEFKAHKLILSTRSLVFSKMFEHDTKENRENVVAIEDSTSEAVKAMLHYLYVGELDELSFETYLQLYALADKYGFQILGSLCAEFFVSNLTVERVCEVAVFAHLCNDAELLSVARGYFQSNMKLIVVTEEWIRLVSEYKELAKELAR